MYAELVDWAKKNLLKPELALASPEDMSIPRCVNTADEAIALIRENYAKWQGGKKEPAAKGKATPQRASKKK
jgi:hypothetical protein